MVNEPEFIFVERARKDVFSFVVDLSDELTDLEVKVIFVNGKLHAVEEPNITVVRDQWVLRKVIARMIENAEMRLSDEKLPLVRPSSNDGAPPEVKMEVVGKEEMEKALNPSKKLTAEKVAYWRRYFRDPKHRNLVVGSCAKRLGVHQVTLSQALLGETWASADELEPPLTRVEYNNALAYPAKYGK